MVGTDTGAVTFVGQNGKALSAVAASQPPVSATPTRTADNHVVQDDDGGLDVLQGAQVASKVTLRGESLAPAAASRSHVFPPRPAASSPTTRPPRSGSAPSTGRAAGSPRRRRIRRQRLCRGEKPALRVSGRGVEAAEPDERRAQGRRASKPAGPDPGADGWRLAAERMEPTGRRDQGRRAPLPAGTCPATLAARRSPPASASSRASPSRQVDTQAEKVKAETLDGQACTKKKCKVFDLIVRTR